MNNIFSTNAIAFVLFVRFFLSNKIHVYLISIEIFSSYCELTFQSTLNS